LFLSRSVVSVALSHRCLFRRSLLSPPLVALAAARRSLSPPLSSSLSLSAARRSLRRRSPLALLSGSQPSAGLAASLLP
jgi:hypothetical protein